MVTLERASRLLESVKEILGKDNLTIKDVQVIINAHTNVLDTDKMILEQIQDKNYRKLIP